LADERKAIPLRISPLLHQQLNSWADQELRSLNAQIEYILREAVRLRRGGTQPDAPGETVQQPPQPTAEMAVVDGPQVATQGPAKAPT